MKTSICLLSLAFLLLTSCATTPINPRLSGQDLQETAVILIQLPSDQDHLNQKIQSTFQSQFDFCPTYFFRSEEAIKIQQGHLGKVNLVDTNNQKIKIESIKGKDLIVGKFGSLDDNQFYETSANQDRSDISQLFNFVLMDQNFVPIYNIQLCKSSSNKLKTMTRQLTQTLYKISMLSV